MAHKKYTSYIVTYANVLCGFAAEGIAPRPAQPLFLPALKDWVSQRCPDDFTAVQWHEMKAHYGSRCVYCGKKQQRLTQDHIVPLSKGGAHTKSNIVPACRSCNSKKGTGNVLAPIQPLFL